MNPRRVQVGLLGGMALLLIVILLSLRRGGQATLPPGEGQPPAVKNPQTTGLVYRSYKEGHERWVLQATGMRGKDGDSVVLEGVSFASKYMARGEPGTFTIAGDRCNYSEAQQRAVFRGNVRITTADGFELNTDSLTYRGDRGVARTDDAAKFRRKDVSGSSTGFDYDAEQGRLVLAEDVFIRVEDPDQPVAEIRSRRAVADKRKSTLRFIDDVDATQGGDRLKTQQLTLDFDPETQDLRRATAARGVDLRTTGAAAMPGVRTALGSARGARLLRSKRLDLRYRPDRTLQGATVVGSGDLTLLPGPGEKPEKRRLRAEFMDFGFDEQGRLAESSGRKAASMVVEPLVKGKGEVLTVKSDRYKAKLDPESGDPDSILFKGNVSFERGAQQATSERARFVGKGSQLHLADNAQLAQEGSQLTAWSISVGTESGDVDARRDVHHVLRGQKAAARPGLLGGGEAPTVITSRDMKYDSASKTATYKNEALLRAGKDEVRAPMLVIVEDAGGARKLTASSGVVSLLHPRASQPEEKPPAPVDGRAKTMLYEEAAGRLVYTDDVTLKQGDIVTRSPKATVTLTPDGRGVEKLVAGEPVEVQQESRRATGKQAVYTPANETVVLTGDDVEAVDGLRTTRGRSLTFHVGDDTFLVDGREEGRTETILKKEPSPP
jgi:lipopolysaccharide transport protein LptA/LPS export ABC transporter protein LptC